MNVAYYSDHREYQADLYRRELRAEAIKLGALLLIFFGAQQGLVWLAIELIRDTGTAQFYNNSASMRLLFSAAISSFIFFVISAGYCLIRRKSFARLFPFERIGTKLLAPLCVVGLTVTLMSNYAAQLTTEVFTLFGVSNRGGDIIASGVEPPVFLYYLTVAVLPALAEEFAFRGVIMGSLRPYSDGLALVISSAAFALMHGNFVQIPFTFCCGMAFGFIAIRTNSLLPSIIIHFLNNALSVTYDVVTSYHLVSTATANIIYNLLVMVLIVVSIFLIRWIIKTKPDLFRFEDSDNIIPYKNKMKLTALSPTMLSFGAVMLLYAGYRLFG